MLLERHNWSIDGRLVIHSNQNEWMNEMRWGDNLNGFKFGCNSSLHQMCPTTQPTNRMFNVQYQYEITSMPSVSDSICQPWRPNALHYPSVWVSTFEWTSKSTQACSINTAKMRIWHNHFANDTKRNEMRKSGKQGKKRNGKMTLWSKSKTMTSLLLVFA